MISVSLPGVYGPSANDGRIVSSVSGVGKDYADGSTGLQELAGVSGVVTHPAYEVRDYQHVSAFRPQETVGQDHCAGEVGRDCARCQLGKDISRFCRRPRLEGNDRHVFCQDYADSLVAVEIWINQGLGSGEVALH
ncbi:Uncharacterised protein [uncultured archaeon]|nr:Uncharacterised protein [uncultured archaeon]